MTTLLIATRNSHKIAEIQQILGANFCVRALTDFPDAPPVIEDADTFAGNARKKAETIARWLSANSTADHFHVLADDSGLEVDVLGGAPGVHSARFAAADIGGHANSPDSANNAKLLALLGGIPTEKRTARFRCVLALAPAGSGKTSLFDGVCEGRIAVEPFGSGGFGYDPLFVPEGHTLSLAALGEDVKNKLSHRARALEKLRQYFL